MTVRVHELAKELKLTSKELIDKLKALKVDAKSHMSVLTDENVKALKAAMKPAAAPSKSAAAPVAASAKKPADPSSGGKPAAAKTDSFSQAPSIESAKRELLLQKTARAAVTTEPRKNMPFTSAPGTIKR